jgi:hypothetical protein
MQLIVSAANAATEVVRGWRKYLKGRDRPARISLQNTPGSELKLLFH